MIVSLPFHALLVAILAGWSVPSGSIGRSDEPAVDIVVALAPVSRDAAPAAADTPSVDTQPFVESSELLDPAPPSITLVTEGGGQSIRPAGIVASGGGGAGGGAEVRFFGSAGKGRRIGYAVDSSGSMLAAGRLIRARAELARSIGSLPDYVSVCIAFFSEDCVTPPPPVVGGEDIRGFVKARPEKTDALRAWMQTVSAKGGTRPSRAIRHLFNYRDPPDVIFLLSDGEINEEEVEAILSINRARGPAPIHCILFNAGDSDQGQSLQRIAQETGGTFRRTAMGDGGG